MGSPYLLAHGLGRPVANAVTTFQVTDADEYTVWVRTKDWAPSGSPGRFGLSLHGATLATDFGTNGPHWAWQRSGTVALPAGQARMALHDRTGFDGRCDAMLLIETQVKVIVHRG